MKNLILTFIMCLLSLCSFAQFTKSDTVATDSLSFQKGDFFQNGKRLNRVKVTSLMMDNPEAYAQLKSAFSDLGVANFFAGLGGALIGWPLGTAIAGGKPLWLLAGIGAGCALISIPIYASYKNKSTKAVRIHNQRLATNHKATGMRLRLNFSGSGIGLQLRF